VVLKALRSTLCQLFELRRNLYLRAVQSLCGQEHNQLSQILKGRLFWIWNPTQHKQEDIKTKGDCCFNHLISLPRKDGIEKSIFDYEKLFYDSLLSPEFYYPSNTSTYGLRKLQG
jgi:hypothetical protein